MARDSSIERVLAMVKVDFKPDQQQPAWSRWGLASLVALIGSLVADAAIVAIGTHLFPSSKGYVHFRFSDYAKLTVIGVVIACVAWPIVTRISSAPRWLFLRSAVLVTLVLFLPDLWIFLRGAPGKAVLVLLAMHVAIALVTYNALVHLSPAGTGGASRTGRPGSR
jgi:hypothetical protein